MRGSKIIWGMIGLIIVLGVGTACTIAAPPPTSNHHTAATVTPTPAPGCAFAPIDFDHYGGAAFQNPVEIVSANGILSTTLVITYANHQIADCQVHLRSYNGQLVGPTLRARPGDTLYIHLRNELTATNPADHTLPLNQPHDFNTTNLHTHGLHVSPVGNSDNVLLEIQPGEAFHYEIKIPPTHPPGTFWYHAHVHGATAIQVSSGMAGALIIEGGLDDIAPIATAAEQIFVFQQISYDEQGTIENFDNTFGPGSWETMEREHTINGVLLPTIAMQPGEVQRWRMIHGGIRETIMVQLVGPGAADSLPNTQALDALRNYPLNEVAVDGLALGDMVAWPQVELQPGYRSDILVTAPITPGNYFLIDAATPFTASLHGVVESTNVLARLVIAGTDRAMTLPSPAELAALKPLPDIVESEIKGTQVAGFCVCATANGGVEFTVNGRGFSLDYKRTLPLGQAQEWLVYTDEQSLAPAHPFHIHVNPFQVARTLPNGETALVWRDTLLVRKGQPQRLLTRYLDYIGQYVMHCHILDHEDQGMMELIEVVN